MIDKQFVFVLKRLRNEKGLHQEELAANIGLQHTYISQLERGIKRPTLKVVSKIAAEFGISLSKFMAQVEKME
jgi:transcriptional regulator with XRE-family HTH domain